MATEKKNRKEHILQCLASMLETNPGARITTAALAKEVGVSEAALYRHFPSKAKMFEGLIIFIEDTIFSRITIILNEQQEAVNRCEQVISLLITFAEKNPGFARILTGDALAGESERLRARVAQFYSRVETQLKQIIREAEIRENLKPAIDANALANLLLAIADGKIVQYVRSEFKALPNEHWPAEWSLLKQHLFVEVTNS